MSASGMRRSLVTMKRRVLFLLLVTGLIMLALAGWTVRGARWLTTGGRRPPLPQPA